MNLIRSICPSRATSFFACTAIAIPIAFAIAAPDDASKSPGDRVSEPDRPYALRVERDGKRSIALQTSVRRFVAPADDTSGNAKPIVDLVGVSHIGDASYYAALQTLLDSYDVVLYESVGPPGSGGLPGSTPGERIAFTERAARFVLDVVSLQEAAGAEAATDLAGLRGWTQTLDPRLADWLDRSMRDGWGHEFQWPGGEHGDRADAITSLGSDGAAGGRGEAKDRTYESTGESRLAGMLPPSNADGDGDGAASPAAGGIQMQLADALDLSFQLVDLDYDRPHFVPSDMAIDEVQEAMKSRGSDFTMLEDTLSGSSVPAQIAEVLLGVIRAADRFSGGAASGTVKLTLVEMLGDEMLTEASLEQVDPALGDVIIDLRNQRVIDDLNAMLPTLDSDDTVAIFYGAGHLIDFRTQLIDQLGYVESGDASWLSAITIDLVNGPVDARDAATMRRMVQGMVAQTRRQMGLAAKAGERDGDDGAANTEPYGPGHSSPTDAVKAFLAAAKQGDTDAMRRTTARLSGRAGARIDDMIDSLATSTSMARTHEVVAASYDIELASVAVSSTGASASDSYVFAINTLRDRNDPNVWRVVAPSSAMRKVLTSERYDKLRELEAWAKSRKPHDK